jgi:hypothetical protein
MIVHDISVNGDKSSVTCLRLLGNIEIQLEICRMRTGRTTLPIKPGMRPVDLAVLAI